MEKGRKTNKVLTVLLIIGTDNSIFSVVYGSDHCLQETQVR